MPRKPLHIPLELHTRILAHVPSAPAWPHLAWLWRGCRPASPLVRAAAEQVVVDRHLRRPRAVRIVFPLGAAAIGATVYEMEVPMGFEGDGDDGDGGEGEGGGRLGGGLKGKRAVFGDVRPAECFGAGVLEATTARWTEAVESWTVVDDGDDDDGSSSSGALQQRENDAPTTERKKAKEKKKKNKYVSLRPEAWRYWVEIRGLALDPELPDLRVDYEKRQISFDWRRMLDEFFGEEAYARRRLDEMETLKNEVQTRRELEGDDAGAIASFCDGTRIPEEGMIRDGALNGDTLLDTRRDVEEQPETEAYLAARRQRIKKWYKERDAQGQLRGGDWSTSEGVLPSDAAAERERVLEMLRLREDLAKDVSICDNANEVRAVYRWNPEHDSISL